MSDPTVGIEPAERCPGCARPVDESWLNCASCGVALVAPAELAEGALLAERYVVQRVLGRGGFGITYAVHDSRLRRTVALKELFPPAAVRHGSRVLAAPRDQAAFREARDRFLREARLLARFTHPGIVRVYEVFEAHNTAYLVMELLDGSTLAELLASRGRPFTPSEVLDVAARVGAALAEVHAADLLHRDVNPSNVMVTRSGRVVLIDFGLARRYGGDATSTITRAVTPGFAPPEQYAGTGPLGPSTDVYGLAATLYRVLTAQVPPSGLDRQAGTPLRAPADLVDSVPKQLSDAVLDGLELQPAHRPATATAFLARLGVPEVEPSAHALLHTPPGEARTPDLTEVGDDGLPSRGSPSNAPATSVGSLGEHPPAATPHELATLADPRTRHAAGPGGSGGPGGAGGGVGPGGPGGVAHRQVRVAEPIATGPHPKGRKPLTVAVTVAIAALASSTPVVVAVLLVLLALPVLATIGDVALHRRRQAAGAASKRWHRAAPSSVVPVHVLRNVVVSVMRAIPALAIGGVVVAVAALARHADAPVARDVVLRVGGALVACTIVIPARNDGRGFPSGTGLSTVLARFLEPGGRTSSTGWVAVVVCVALSAAGLLLHPELWPLPW